MSQERSTENSYCGPASWGDHCGRWPGQEHPPLFRQVSAKDSSVIGIINREIHLLKGWDVQQAGSWDWESGKGMEQLGQKPRESCGSKGRGTTALRHPRL